MWRGVGRKKGKNSKNRKINGERKRLVEFLEEKGWDIFNGSMRGDEEGEFTFTGERAIR